MAAVGGGSGVGVAGMDSVVVAVVGRRGFWARILAVDRRGKGSFACKQGIRYSLGTQVQYVHCTVRKNQAHEKRRESASQRRRETR